MNPLQIKGKEIDRGGEGTIYEFPGNKVFKQFHQPRPKSFGAHLEWLKTLPAGFVKPIDIFEDHSGIIGFTMPYVDLKQYHLFSNLFQNQWCLKEGFGPQVKSKIFANLKKLVETAHSLGVIVGDLNQFNIFVKRDGEVLLMDVDSYGTSSKPHSGILLEDIRDFRNSSVSKESDAWAYDVLVFYAHTYVHPFRGTLGSETFEQRIRDRKSIVNPKYKGSVKLRPFYNPFPSPLETQFHEVFDGDRRFMIATDGSTAFAPISIQPIQNVITGDVNVKRIADVDEFESFGNLGYYRKDDTYFILNLSQKGCYSVLKTIKADKVFLGANKGVYTINGKWFDFDDKPITLPSGKCFWMNGTLSILAVDRMYIYDLNNQMLGNVEGYSIEVFSKSLKFNEGYTQRLGAGMFMWIFNKTHAALQTNLQVQSFQVDGQIVLAEHLMNGKLKYSFGKYHGQKFTQGPESDQCNFGFGDGKIFCTSNNELKILDDNFNLIAKLNCSVIDPSSKIKWNPAGILVQTGSSLYLLNK